MMNKPSRFPVLGVVATHVVEAEVAIVEGREEESVEKMWSASNVTNWGIIKVIVLAGKRRMQIMQPLMKLKKSCT
ncbi:hypothetical protein L195_g031106 [Trifolium pratense]|uniref:Uncharacterized protein n=1 Tax=Trifolium pratense TaxID=57577 RepID=A0A2K3L9G1_TRIPR|nr:hypothetical protein L195_g031106 [Trifolium pratense]